MDAERWRRVRALFEEAVDLDAPRAFLARECADADQLRREVEALLASESAAPADFATPPACPSSVEVAAGLGAGPPLPGFAPRA